MSSTHKSTLHRNAIAIHKCPICELKNPKALSIVKVGITTLLPPFNILQKLKSAHFAPVDELGQIINTPNRWRNVLHFHVESCTGGDYSLYERAWQAKQNTSKLSSEFRRTVKNQGVTGNEDEDELRLKMMIINSLGDDPSKLALIKKEGLVNKDELLLVFRELIPTILTQQLQIIDMAQVEYLSGAREHAPISEFLTVKKCLDVMKMVVGDYGIENTIADVIE